MGWGGVGGLPVIIFTLSYLSEWLTYYVESGCAFGGGDTDQYLITGGGGGIGGLPAIVLS